MKRILLISFLLVAILPPAPSSFGQDGEVKGFSCLHCKSTGRIPNPAWEDFDRREAAVRYCSFTMENDPVGWGSSWLPCETCRRPDLKAKAVEDFEKELAARKQWLAERREIDDQVKAKRPLLHLQTEHFVWAWSIRKFKLGKKVIDGHEGLHLFAERMEKFYDDFLEIHKTKPADNLYNFHRLYVFWTQAEGQAATGEYAQQYSPSGKMTLPGHGTAVVTWWDKSKAPSEADLYRELIHNVTHLFTSSYRTGGWSYQTGVAYEGLAHWWEIHWDGKASAYCRQEVDFLAGWVAEDWNDRVRKMVLKKKAPSLTEILQKNGGTLDADEHMAGWSYMDFMMSMDPRKTLDFIALLKAKNPPRNAFLDIWEWSPLGFEEKWVEYVKKEYAGK